MPYQSEHAELLTLCTRAAKAAGAVIAAAADQARSLNWTAKSPTDFVSEVDLAAEARILEIFGAELPEAAILAEETAPWVPPERLAKGLAVVADPLDGTTNFLHGYPEFAVSIAVLRDGEPVAAVVFDVPGNELFIAAAGAGSWLNGERCRVSTTTEAQRALIGSGFPFKDPAGIAPYVAQLAKVMAGVSGVRRPGAASIDLASVACGRFDAFWETKLSAWDFAAGMLLVREAGGTVTDLRGAHLRAWADSSVLAGGPAMYRWLRDVVAPE
jgi:myo-inositol-1(or 4)-monophosphatase